MLSDASLERDPDSAGGADEGRESAAISGTIVAGRMAGPCRSFGHVRPGLLTDVAKPRVGAIGYVLDLTVRDRREHRQRQHLAREPV
jgi:hypothetical protein